jgi:hypothetical protein
MDSTNFFNHPPITIGDRTATSTTFGKIASAGGQRRIQFALYWRF